MGKNNMAVQTVLVTFIGTHETLVLNVEKKSSETTLVY